VRRTP
jgi:integrase